METLYMQQEMVGLVWIPVLKRIQNSTFCKALREHLLPKRWEGKVYLQQCGIHHEL